MTISPPPAPNWWQIIQEWAPGSLGLIGLGAVQGVRMWWRDYRDGKDPEIKADKAERTETREWLSRQDARVRTIVEQTAVENDKLRKRVDDLETDVASERKSGMDHYERSLRMYDVMVEWLHSWRNGRTAPEKMPDYDSL